MKVVKTNDSFWDFFLALPCSPNFNVVEYLNFRLSFWSLLVNNFPKKLKDENSTFKNNIEIGGGGGGVICLTYFVKS